MPDKISRLAISFVRHLIYLKRKTGLFYQPLLYISIFSDNPDLCFQSYAKFFKNDVLNVLDDVLIVSCRSIANIDDKTGMLF